MIFLQLSQQIKHVHEVLQQYAVKAVNVGLTIRNLLIGYYIVEYEQQGDDKATYGEKLLEKLSVSLAGEGLKNISQAELSRFRQFYTTYPQILGTLSQKSLQLPASILGTVSQKLIQMTDDTIAIEPLKLLSSLSFSHFAELIKISDPLKRTFYEIECINGTWGIRELRRQINSLFFERTGLSKQPEKLIHLVHATAEQININEVIKSPFTFEFLGLKSKDVVTESNIEQAIMENIQHFLLELGNGFCFEARQKKILIEDEYFFIDLVFYHRILHCHVLVEIKTEEFKHEHIGQLNVYLEHYKRHEMHGGDNPPVGILLVTNKNNTLVEYAKGAMDNQLFVSKYLLELPHKEDLIQLIRQEISKY
ncbi:MAG: PDDEXK nuclease domain-containing protein [Prevotellaceae bacterium]|jgi:predicted nuclease of restriction endonuclease-like (RecB) superfamily|nr:PDDEXK nuclease domain-containing protein [Prevotellaceae bacterium]